MKRLVLKKAVAVLVTSVIFLILFYLFGGWNLEGGERYKIAGFSSLSTIFIIGIISQITGELNFLVNIVSLVVFIPIVLINSIIVNVVIIIAVLILLVFIIFSKTDEKRDKISLIIEGLVILIIIWGITFL
jgi:hypothetical protein